MKTCFECHARFGELEFRNYSFCPYCGRNFSSRRGPQEKLRERQFSMPTIIRQTPRQQGIFNDSSEFGVNIGQRTLAIDKHKFATIVPRCKEWMLQNPGKSVCAGLAVAILGSGLVAASSPIIAAGVAVGSFGSAVCTIGLVVAGLGVVFGVVGKEPRLVVSSLKLGVCAIATGAGIMVTGMILQGIGYVSLVGGLALIGGGLIVAGIAGRMLMSQTENSRMQIPEAATEEQRSILTGLSQTAKSLRGEAIRKGFNMNENTAVYVLNMKDINGNVKI